jgi:hypothetical protein
MLEYHHSRVPLAQERTGVLIMIEDLMNALKNGVEKSKKNLKEGEEPSAGIKEIEVILKNVQDEIDTKKNNQ